MVGIRRGVACSVVRTIDLISMYVRTLLKS